MRLAQDNGHKGRNPGFKGCEWREREKGGEAWGLDSMSYVEVDAVRVRGLF